MFFRDIIAGTPDQIRIRRVFYLTPGLKTCKFKKVKFPNALKPSNINRYEG